MNLNKHLIIRCITDFKVWWPQDPTIHVCETQLNSQPGDGDAGGSAAFIFLGKPSGLSLKGQSWEETHVYFPIPTGGPAFPPSSVPPSHHLQEGNLLAFTSLSETTAAESSRLPRSCLAGTLSVTQRTSFVHQAPALCQPCSGVQVLVFNTICLLSVSGPGECPFC